MAKTGSLAEDGRTLALIGDVIAAVLIALSFIASDTGSVVGFSLLDQLSIGGTLGLILTILFIFILYFIAINRINIGEDVIEGLLIILLGLIIGGIGGLIAAFGGILIVLDAIF